MKNKYCILDNLIPLTSLQIDVYMSLVRHSDERFAFVRGVYYKDIVKEVDCCNQSFYNSIEALKKHEIIKVSRASDLDYDVYICGNEYPDQDYSETYVNFNDDVFYMKEFKDLKAHEKYLFLYLYQYTFVNKKTGKDITWKKNKKDFYEEMQKKLNVTLPVLRKYLHTLRHFYYIWTLNGNLFVKRKPITLTETVREKTEEEWMLEQYLVSECHRQRMDFESSTVEGLMNLLKAYRSNFNIDATLVALGKMLSAMKDSIAGLRPKDRRLSGGYVNKLFTSAVMDADENEAPDMDILYKREMLSLCM